MELSAWLAFGVCGPEEDTSVWGSLPACSHHPFRNEDFLLSCKDGGPGILIMHHSPFGDVYVDGGGLKETSTKPILITSAALKEFLQIIFSKRSLQPLWVRWKPPAARGSCPQRVWVCTECSWRN